MYSLRDSWYFDEWKKWPYDLSLVWCWLQVYPRCWLLVVSPLGTDSKQGVSADSEVISFIFPLFQFCSGCPASILVSEQTPICLKYHHKSIQNQTKKKKRSFHRIFSTSRNPATTPPSKSLHDIFSKPTSENHFGRRNPNN